MWSNKPIKTGWYAVYEAAMYGMPQRFSVWHCHAATTNNEDELFGFKTGDRVMGLNETADDFPINQVWIKNHRFLKLPEPLNG